MIERPKTGKVVSLMLTWQCNLRCKYCFEKYKSSGKEMAPSMAKNLILKEVHDFKEQYREGQLKIEFFGGEPLLQFNVIKEVTEWVVDQNFDVDFVLSVTTNGTLLTDEIKDWFRRYNHIIQIIMSVDGSEEMQRVNRGDKATEAPLDFVREVWPNIHFKSTISRSNLPVLAEGIIHLLESGHVVAPSLAIGEDWQPGDEKIYKSELEKLADWHLSHPDIEPMRIFQQPFFCLLEPYCNETPLKNCGTGTTMVTYDVDGTPYPCHLFVPINHDHKNAAEELSQIDFNDDALFQDPSCKDCKILRICKTCYGFNYRDRGSIVNRDRRACRMQLVEAQIVSDFQINWLMDLQKHRQLKPVELLALKGAIKCHDLFHDMVPNSI